MNYLKDLMCLLFKNNKILW